MIDLHTHTNCSDGLLSPFELLELAAKYKLEAIAITDHDNINAYSPELFQKAKEMKIELIPGIELSTRGNGHKYHIVGLFLDLENIELKNLVKEIAEHRKNTSIQIMKLLHQNGWEVDIDEVIASCPVITKPHIARSVLNNPNNKAKLLEVFKKIPDYGQFIEKLMRRGCPCYVHSDDVLRPEQAISAVHNAHGLAFLAHPSFNILLGEDPKTLADTFLNLGIDGFEVVSIEYNSENDEEVEHRDFFTKYAQEHNLLTSGGSDFHEQPKDPSKKFIDLGFHNHAWEVPYSFVEKMKEKLA